MGSLLFQSADFYGASKIIFGNSRRPFCYKASWIHGLGNIIANNYDKKTFIHFDEYSLPIHLVNNNETSDALQKQDIKAIPVGVPYIYTDVYSRKLTHNKIFNRLYMPSHSIGLKQDFSSKYQDWKKIILKYNCDSICLGGKDFNQLMQRKIDLGNIKILKGAYAADNTSLDRMAKIFSSTSEMVTDARGSHLFYAAASGARVRVLDELIKNFDSQAYKSYLKNIPSKFTKTFEQYWLGLAADIKNFSSSIWFTGHDMEIKEYSEYVLGVQCLKNKKEIIKLLKPLNIIQSAKISSKLLFNKISRKF